MILLALVPLLVAGATAVAAPALSRRMAPTTASAVLTVLALSAALTTGAMLCLAALVGLKLAVPALRPSDWSAPAVREVLPLPPVAGVLAGAVAAVPLAAAAIHAVRVGVRLRSTVVAARALPVDDGLAVIRDDRAQACAVPGRPGRVVVSTGLLEATSGLQRDAVIEHERSHLRHRHHVYAQLVRLAACANPLLWRVVPAVDVALERWADADAARAVGSRRIVAHALGTVALSHPAIPGPALGMGGRAVVERVRFLLEPPARRSRLVVTGTVLMAAVVWAAAVWTAVHVHGLVEAAEAAYLATR